MPEKDQKDVRERWEQSETKFLKKEAGFRIWWYIALGFLVLALALTAALLGLL